MKPKRRITLKADATGKFFYPIGIEMDEGENYRQVQAYEVNYLYEEEFPRYQYVVVVSIERIASLFEKLAEHLPEWVSVIMEVPSPEERGQDYCDVWVSPPIPRQKMLEIFRKHVFLFCHDGMVGFGAAEAEQGGVELFLDDHKILYYHNSEFGRIEDLLGAENLTSTKKLRHFSDLSHVHFSLNRKNQGEDYLKVLEILSREIGLEWQDTKEY